jgi:hypothetical protein
LVLTLTDIAGNKLWILDSGREALDGLIAHAEKEIITCSTWDNP